MNTIVMNTKTGAVSEYDWAFQSITPLHLGDATGLYTLGGDKDNAANIASSILTGTTLGSASLVNWLDSVYFSLQGTGQGTLLLKANTDNSPRNYTFTVRANGESRAKPARGLRQNYFAYGYANVGGVDFRLDRIEVPVGQSDTRRI